MSEAVTDEQIQELLNLASLSPSTFDAHYPPPIGMTRTGWRLAVVTDCSAALGRSNAVSLSEEANERLNRQARRRCADILKLERAAAAK